MRVEVDTSLTVGDLIELKDKNVLRVNHEYQRGLRWTEVQKRMFLDSIFRDYSIPAFYFHMKKVQAGSISNTFYDIVDGQQRVDAICTYADSAYQLIDPSDTAVSRFPNFVKGKPCPWAGQRYNELSNDLREKLERTKVIVYMLETEDENEVRDLFIRLQGGTPLTPQDKRDSWPGNFTEFVLRIGGKPQVPKWPGHPLFDKLVKGNDSRRRQLAAQTYMLFDSARRKAKFPIIKSANIDEFYHQNVGFNDGSDEVKRFEKICDGLYDALSGRQKLVGHHLLHSVLLFDSLMDKCARGWEEKFAARLHEFERCCQEASKAAKLDRESPLLEYWRSYAQWTQNSADIGNTIQGRHAFFALEMVNLLEPKGLDGRRSLSDLEREIVFYRDRRLCQHCSMDGTEHDVQWADAEVHHVRPLSEEWRINVRNGALVHRDCHASVEDERRTFRSWWENRGSPMPPGKSKSLGRTLPPDGTSVEFEYRGRTFRGSISGGQIRLDGPGNGTYKTFSSASRGVTRTARNGWRDWLVRLPGDDSWMRAEQWREDQR